MLKFDPHVHTRFSDGAIFYNGLIDLKKLIKRDKITAFTITDHNTTKGLDYTKRACKKLSLPFIPGIEISTKDGHIAAYGIEEWSHGAYTLKLPEALDILNDMNAVIVIAHPYDRRMGAKDLLFDPEVIKRVDGYELMNGASPFANLKLSRMDRGPLKDLCVYSGSDCHSMVLYCKYHVELDCNSTRLDDILECMRDRRKVKPKGFMLDILHWIADYPPAETKRRKLKKLKRKKSP
ncbi:MAG: PHP domain-containing protein [Candidatus Hodarchaeota archaeon]